MVNALCLFYRAAGATPVDQDRQGLKPYSLSLYVILLYNDGY